MSEQFIKILEIGAPVIIAIVGIFIYTSKNKNIVKNKNSNNINNSRDVKSEHNNNGISNNIEK